MVSPGTEEGGASAKTYRDRAGVEEGDLCRVEVDVAIGFRLVESRSHKVGKIGWNFHR